MEASIDVNTTTGTEPAVQYSHRISGEQVVVTEAARRKIAELIADVGEDIAGVRVFVAGGGCGGMQYGMTFTEESTEYDSVLEGEGFRVLIDPVALGFLEGSEIDYQDDGMQSTFVFNNVFQSVGGSGRCGGCGGGAF